MEVDRTETPNMTEGEMVLSHRASSLTLGVVVYDLLKQSGVADPGAELERRIVAANEEVRESGILEPAIMRAATSSDRAEAIVKNAARAAKTAVQQVDFIRLRRAK